jgi:putative hydrolase of the HAD superfamily
LSPEAVISDFGGVLTTPLLHSFVAFQDQTGIDMEALGKAMQRISERDGAHPLYELEKGQLTEAEFLEQMADALTPDLGHRPEMHRFTEIYFEALEPNPPMVELMRELRGRGLRMGLLTNNVREWSPLWRAMVPVEAGTCLFVDDVEVNCDAARELGMAAVHFRDNDQAIPEIRNALNG